MKLLIKCSVFEQITKLYVAHASRKLDHRVIWKQYLSTSSNKFLKPRYSMKPTSTVCAYYSNDKKQFIQFEKKAEALKDAFNHKKEQLRDTEHRIRQRGGEFIRDIKHQKEITGQKLRETKDHLVQDILVTKAKVKERLEGVVEKDNPFTIPNLLCVTRIAMAPYIGYTTLHEQYELALGLLFFAGISDMLDGWIARKWESQSSAMGSFLDPMADKILIAVLFVSLTCQNLIPLWLTLLIVGRDTMLVVAAFVIRYRSLPPPRTLSRYFDVTAATAQLAPTFISKVNTAVQLLLVGTTLASPVFDYVDHPVVNVLVGITAGSTLLSAVSYLVSKNTYKFLRKKS